MYQALGLPHNTPKIYPFLWKKANQYLKKSGKIQKSVTLEGLLRAAA
jgi:hypothetical protein